MKSFFGYLACFALFYGGSITSANSEPDAGSLEQRLDSIQTNMNLMFMHASEQLEALTAEIHNLKQSLDILGWYSEQVKHSVASVQDSNELLARNLSILTYQSAEIVANQQYCANHEALKNLFFELTPKCGAFNSTPTPEVVHVSCSEGPSRSGVYSLVSNVSGHQYKAYCNMDDFGGGWTVFQKRLDGSVDFNRSWSDYRNGFGDVSGEYWLGLETLHLLTTRTPHELLVILESFNGSTSYARYTGIVIDNEQQKYKIYFNSSGTGSAADSFYPYRGEIFVTIDAPSGSYSACTRELASGFWHYSCSSSESRNNVNGVYGSSSLKNGIWWYNSFTGYTQYESLKGVQMMIREKRT